MESPPFMVGEDVNFLRESPSQRLNFSEDSIQKLIIYLIQKQEYCIWVDLACGNGAALRQGRKFLERKGYPLQLLKTYGYDALPIDELKIMVNMMNYPSDFSNDLLREEYSHTFFQEDIHYTKYPEPPNLITCVEALYYTENPLQIFANAASQLRQGGFLCLNGLHRLHYVDDSVLKEKNLFIEIYRESGTIPGFRVIDNFSLPIETHKFILEKQEPIQDYTYGFRLSRTTEAKQGFSYFYSRL